MVCIDLGTRTTSLYLSKSTDSKISKDVTINGSYARLLKPFQIEGIRFMYRRFLEGGGVILNDESGLGKTVQIVLFLSSIQSSSTSKTLILCHENQINHWLYHFFKWSTEKPVLYDEDFSQACFVVASLKQYEALTARKWDIIVVDNLDPLNTIKQVAAAKPAFKIWLSSTNLQADKKQLYKTLDWVSGSSVGSQKDFEKTFSSNNNGDLSYLWKLRQCLQVMCSRWLLRRTTLSVANQLPIRTDDYKKSFAEWLDNLRDTKLSLDNEVTSYKKLVLKQEPPVVCLDKLNSAITSGDQPMIAVRNLPEEESSPSILDFIPVVPADESFKRKGKDDTGLKIKRSKPAYNNNVHKASTNISSCNQSVPNNTCETVDNATTQVTKRMQNNRFITSNNMGDITDIATRIQPNVISVKIETESTELLNISDPTENLKDAKFYLLDSFFSDSSNKGNVTEVADVKLEKGEIDLHPNQNKFLKHSLEDHSKNVQEKEKFRLLDDFFFSSQNIRK